MNTTQGPPPNGPPRAIVVLDSIESEQPVMTPPASVVQTPPRASPSMANEQQRVPASQVPMQHIITIEHGDNLGSWRTIHEDVLCRHSQYMRQLSVRSELLREKYEKCKEISNQLGSVVSLGLSSEHFETKKLEVKLSSIMTNIEKYPIQEYQKFLDKVVGECMDQHYMDKNYLQCDDRPRTLKSFQALGLKSRLSFLNAEGALDTAEATWMQLQKIMNMEKQKAQTNVPKAWAQGRLILRGATEESVLSLVEWAYLPTLPEVSPEHLYDLWGLAARLKFEALAEECMAGLFDTAHASIDNALSNGTSLRYLLGLCDEQNTPDQPGQSNEVVATIFRHVLKDGNPPTKLSNLVVQTIARGIDQELWSQLSPMVNHDTARKVIEAMIAYRHVKAEQVIEETSNIEQEGQLGRCDLRLQVLRALDQDASSK